MALPNTHNGIVTDPEAISGGVAHLVERLNGIEKVRSSTLLTSTTFNRWRRALVMAVCKWTSRCSFFHAEACPPPSKGFPDTSHFPKMPAKPSVRRGRAIGRVIVELLRAKRTANRREKYIESLRQYLRQFARERMWRPIDSFDAAKIEAWFDSRLEAPATRSSNLGRLSSLFAFAARRGYLTENPVRRIEKVFTEPNPPKTLTPDQAEHVLRFAQEHMPRFVPWLALAMFAGVRPEELDKLSWSNVDLERGIVTVDAAASKVRRRRAMPLPSAAVEWLRLGGDLPITRISRRRYIRKLRDSLNLAAWPQDVLRHTAASYLLAEHQDAGKVALWLGNSPKILLAHYQELIGKDAAQKFWAIRPASLHQIDLL